MPGYGGDRMAFRTRVLVATAAAVLGCVLAPGAAFAGLVSSPDATHVTFTGFPDELNNLTVSRTATTLRLVESGTHTGSPIAQALGVNTLGCVQTTTTTLNDTVTCVLTTPGTNVHVDLFDGGDHLSLDPSLAGGDVF